MILGPGRTIILAACKGRGLSGELGLTWDDGTLGRAARHPLLRWPLASWKGGWRIAIAGLGSRSYLRIDSLRDVDVNECGDGCWGAKRKPPSWAARSWGSRARVASPRRSSMSHLFLMLITALDGDCSSDTIFGLGLIYLGFLVYRGHSALPGPSSSRRRILV